jgi:hypothetical protein
MSVVGFSEIQFALFGYPSPGGALPGALRADEFCGAPATLRTRADVDVGGDFSFLVTMECSDEDGTRDNYTNVVVAEPPDVRSVTQRYRTVYLTVPVTVNTS